MDSENINISQNKDPLVGHQYGAHPLLADDELDREEDGPTLISTHSASSNSTTAASPTLPDVFALAPFSFSRNTIKDPFGSAPFSRPTSLPLGPGQITSVMPTQPLTHPPPNAADRSSFEPNFPPPRKGKYQLIHELKKKKKLRQSTKVTTTTNLVANVSGGFSNMSFQDFSSEEEGSRGTPLEPFPFEVVRGGRRSNPFS